jgi:plastocyanin
MKNSQWVFIAIIVILAGAVVYLSVRPVAPAKDNGRTATRDNGAMSEEGKGMASDEDFMKPHLAPELTEAQKAELAAGKASHAPATLTFDVVGGSYYYAPNEITVRQGDTVKIKFTNAGGMHNLTFDDPQIATKTIKTGETDTIEFKADKKGLFEFYCSVGKGSHRMKGQIGVLIVQ